MLQKGCVCAAKQSTFMRLNSLFSRYCTQSGHRILSSILTLGITLRHEKCTKPYTNWQALSQRFQIVAACRINKFKSKLLAFRLHVDSIWVRNLPGPPQYQDPLIHNLTTFKCHIAFYSIATSCHIPPSILFTIHLCLDAYCLIIWLSEHRIPGFRLVFNAHWSVTD